MIKIVKEKNRNGVEFQYIDLGDLMTISPQMYEMNDNHFNSGNFHGQCSLCAKAIKNFGNHFNIICVGNPETAVKLDQENIARDSAGFMDSFQLGPECGKRVKKVIKDSGLNWKDWLFSNKENQ